MKNFTTKNIDNIKAIMEKLFVWTIEKFYFAHDLWKNYYSNTYGFQCNVVKFFKQSVINFWKLAVLKKGCRDIEI